MHKAIPSLVSAAAVVTPFGAAVASAANAKSKVIVVKKTITGSEAQVSRWGYLKVTIVVKKTTTITGKKKKVTRKIVGVTVPESPNHTDRSVYINGQAIPWLVQEVMQSQMNTNIQLISGATDSSYAFVESLQSAILQAKAA
jgi:uncharacterized protein with FMN-binding domain